MFLFYNSWISYSEVTTYHKIFPTVNKSSDAGLSFLAGSYPWLSTFSLPTHIYCATKLGGFGWNLTYTTTNSQRPALYIIRHFNKRYHAVCYAEERYFYAFK